MHIIDNNYVDSLVVALARQGYAPYIQDEDTVCIEICDGELIQLEKK